jgi:hypothetical protein
MADVNELWSAGQDSTPGPTNKICAYVTHDVQWSVTPWTRTREWRYSSTRPHSRHKMEESGQQRTIPVPPDIEARLAGHAAQSLSVYWPILAQRLGGMVRKKQAFSDHRTNIRSEESMLWALASFKLLRKNGDYVLPTNGFLTIASLNHFPKSLLKSPSEYQLVYLLNVSD